MTAICGAVYPQVMPFPENRMVRMMDSLSHHGPDGCATWRGNGVVFGHQMMHITPESLGEELPLHQEESQLAITADARLDNRNELLASLGLRQGDQLSDSQLILKSFEKWGSDCVEKLEGEFAFAIWDGEKRTLYCVTDPMGTRPLFYRRDASERFSFASEVVALLAFGDTQAAINYRRIALMGVSVLTGHLEPETTVFENISRIPAATVMTVSARSVRKRTYWKPDPSNRIHFSTQGEFREAFQEIFFNAVASRARCAFPSGAFLSGGLDSSSIVAAAARGHQRDGKTLTTLSSVAMKQTEDLISGEREFMEEFSAWPEVTMKFVDAAGSGPFQDVEKLVSSASPCSYTFQHFVYTALVRAASNSGVRTILDGHGGELSASVEMAGYLAELFRYGHWRRLTEELRIIDPKRRLTIAPIKRHVLRPLVPYPMQLFLNRQSRFKQIHPYPIRDSFIKQVLGDEVPEIIQKINYLLHVKPDHRENMARQIQYEQRDAQQRMHAGFVDYHKVRISYPYLDRRLIEFCMAAEGELKYRNGEGRRLIRLGMEGILPEKIRRRFTKAAFAPDYHIRYLRDRNLAADYLDRASAQTHLASIIDFEKVRHFIIEPPVYLRDNPIRADYGSQICVPSAVYLCQFLDRFH